MMEAEFAAKKASHNIENIFITENFDLFAYMLLFVLKAT